MTGKRDAQLSEIYNRASAWVSELMVDNREDLLSFGVDIDPQTKTPFVSLGVAYDSKKGAADFPATFGAEKIPVRIERMPLMRGS